MWSCRSHHRTLITSQTIGILLLLLVLLFFSIEPIPNARKVYWVFLKKQAHSHTAFASANAEHTSWRRRRLNSSKINVAKLKKNCSTLGESQITGIFLFSIYKVDTYTPNISKA